MPQQRSGELTVFFFLVGTQHHGVVRGVVRGVVHKWQRGGWNGPPQAIWLERYRTCDAQLLKMPGTFEFGLLSNLASQTDSQTGRIPSAI